MKRTILIAALSALLLSACSAESEPNITPEITAPEVTSGTTAPEVTSGTTTPEATTEAADPELTEAETTAEPADIQPAIAAPAVDGALSEDGELLQAVYSYCFWYYFLNDVYTTAEPAGERLSITDYNGTELYTEVALLQGVPEELALAVGAENGDNPFTSTELVRQGMSECFTEDVVEATAERFFRSDGSFPLYLDYNRMLMRYCPAAYLPQVFNEARLVSNDGEAAVVEFAVTLSNGESSTLTAEFLFTDGAWRSATGIM